MINLLNVAKKFIKTKVIKKWFWKIFSFSWNQIKHNPLFWIINVLLIISQPLILLIVKLTGNDLINNSLYLSLIPQLLLILLNIVLVNRLFSETKYNSIDWLLLSLPITKSKIFIFRFSLIFTIGFASFFLQFIFNFIICLSLNLETKWILYFFVSNIFIEPFINMFYIALIGWIALHFKRVLFSIISLIVLLLFSIPLLTRSLSFNHVSLQYNNKNSDSFAQLSLMKNNSIESYVVDKKNYIFINDNSNQIKDINSSPIYSYFIPGEIFTTFDSSLMKNLFHISDYQDYQIDKKYSLLKNDYLNYNFSNYYNEYTNALILRPEDVNPLFLSNIDYENLLLDNISTIVESNDTNYIQLKDELLVQQLLSDLANDENINWIKLNEKEIMTLRSLLGINTTYNQLFYYQDNYQWFSQKTPNLLERIEIKYNKSLSELLNYLWNSESTQNNINNTFGNIDPIFENVNDLYPSVKVLDNNKMPIKSDIDFIKNDLIRFQNNSIAYLTTNGTYENTNSLTDIDPSIVDKQSWDAYIDNNIFDVAGAQRIIKSLSDKLPNLAQMTFSLNNLNLNQFSYYFTLSDNTYLDHSEIYVTALIFIILFVAWASLNKFKKLNYKNIEYN